MLHALEPVLCAILVEEHLRDTLSRLLRAQSRAAIGSERAMALHRRGVQLAGSEDALHELIAQRQQECACADALCACTSSAAASSSAESREADDLHECVRALSEWLFGLAASDVSVMISLAPVQPHMSAQCPPVTDSGTPIRTVTVRHSVGVENAADGVLAGIQAGQPASGKGSDSSGGAGSGADRRGLQCR